jgi:NAD(P)H-quinone oxidoreductase subunit 5
MAALYGCVVLLQQHPQALQAWRRWSYAGFYVDEIYTRIALQLWPTSWGRTAAMARPAVASAFVTEGAR